MTTTPIESNDELVAYSVVDLFVPSFKPINDIFPVLITVANTENRQGSCEIPIVFTNVSDPKNIITYMLSITLDIGETKVILAEGISMKEGYFKVEVGQKTSEIIIA